MSNGGEVRSLRELARDVAALVRSRGDARPIVLLDGRSGAGKSTLATPIAEELGAELVRLDDIYPGWDGLEAGSEAVHAEIIPLSRWHRWSWEQNATIQVHHVDPGLPLLIEGCGALSRAGRAAATFGIWIELDADERRRRAIARDGETYLPHWERWARQEERFYARERPDRLADLVLDGAAIPDSAP